MLIRLCGWILVCGLAAGCTRHALLGLTPVTLPMSGSEKPLALFLESFYHLDPERWREVEVRGQTTYSIEELEGARSLKAHSQDGASILLNTFRFDPDTYEWISWRWRVDRLVEGEDLRSKKGSDAAARIYVYFDTPGLPWKKRNIDYVWSGNLPVDTQLNSAYSSSSKIIVVESGGKHLGQWRWVSRNIEEDYERVFGEDVPDVVAIAIMTDTDNTRNEAVAYFDDVMITREPPPAQSVAALPAERQ